MSRPVLLLICALVVASCGEDEPTPPPKRVALTIVAPGDPATVDAERVSLSGRVSPAASEVRVLGDGVDVAGGTFSVDVPLDEGVNLVDVSAASPGRRPASTAIRVIRESRVEVPAVEGDDEEAAVSRLQGLGFEVERRDGGSILDDILGGDPEVCRQEPPAGTKVKRGSTVELVTARSC